MVTVDEIGCAAIHYPENRFYVSWPRWCDDVASARVGPNHPVLVRAGGADVVSWVCGAKPSWIFP